MSDYISEIRRKNGNEHSSENTTMDSVQGVAPPNFQVTAANSSTVTQRKPSQNTDSDFEKEQDLTESIENDYVSSGNGSTPNSNDSTISTLPIQRKGNVIQRRLFGDARNRVHTQTGFTVNNPVFDERRMREELPETSFAGAGDPRLAAAMQSLYSHPEGPALDRALSTIAEIRGIDPSSIRQQYQYATEIRTAGEDRAREQARLKGEAYVPVSPDLDMERHPDFTGSTSQLRFGSILGDVFGVDPVFGALISPTGGLVGPGNESISGPENNPTVLHGTVHDAAGYLRNAHNLGPGYNYLQRGWELDEANPLSGQTSGTAYWADRNPLLQAGATLGTALSHPIDLVRDYEKTFVNSSVEVGEGNAFSAVADGIGWTANKGMDIAKGVGGAAFDTVNWLGNRAGSALGGIAGAAYDTGSWLGDRASSALGGIAGAAYDTGSWLGNRASSSLGGIAGAAYDTGSWLGDRAGSALGGIAGAAYDTGSWLGNRAAGIGDVITGRSSLADWGLETGSQAIGGVSNAVSSTASWLGQTGGQAISGISNAASDTASWLGETGGQAISGVSNAVSNTASWLGETGTHAAKGIGQAASSTASWLGETASQAVSGVSKAASRAGNWGMETANEAWDGLSGAASSTANWASNKASQAVNTVSNTASKAYDWLTDW
jgi:hypothetical protein